MSRVKWRRPTTSTNGMLSLKALVLFACMLNIIGNQTVQACTSIGVGPLATQGGGTITTHADDCFDCDFRIARIPGGKHSEGAVRTVPPMKYTYPRYIGSDRGSTFLPENVDRSIYNWTDSPIVGEVPQVAQTLSYIDGSYAIANEYGVAIGESTCGTVLVSKPVYEGGKALFEISELGRLALERAKTAREAIRVVGSLGEKYGYFSSEWTSEKNNIEGGETYLISDERELWVMHVSPDDTGSSAVWVARRVPDNHVVVVANSFIIREITPESLKTDEWMASSNIFEVAIRAKLWSGDIEKDGHLDWKKHYGWNFTPFRDTYVSRRVWRVLSTAAPSLKLSPLSSSWELPFSVPVEREMHLTHIFDLHRDHFEGTPYDTNKGLAAGPYGNPNRYDTYDPNDDPKFKSGAGLMLTEQAMALEGEKGDPFVLDRSEGMPLSTDEIQTGHFERTISLFRTSYTAVVELRPSTTYTQYASHLQTNGEYDAAKDYYWTVDVPLGYPSQIPYLAMKTKGSRSSALSEITRKHNEAMLGEKVSAEEIASLVNAKEDSSSEVISRSRLTAYRVFIAPHQTKTSVFFPIYPAAVQQDLKDSNVVYDDRSFLFNTPLSLRIGSLYKFTAKSAWWIFCAVSNYAERAWRYIVRDVVKEQSLIESQMLLKTLPMIESKAEAILEVTKKSSKKQNKPKEEKINARAWQSGSDLLNTFVNEQTNEIVERWWQLFWHVITRYHDGYRLDEPNNPEFTSTPLFYPTWWLRTIRWWRQPEGDAAQAMEKDADYWPSSDVCEVPRSLQQPRGTSFFDRGLTSPPTQAVKEVIPSGETASAKALANAAAANNSPKQTKEQILDSLGPIEVDRASPLSSDTVAESGALSHVINQEPSNRVQVTPAGAAKAAAVCESTSSSGWTLIFVAVGSFAAFMSGYFLGTHSAEPASRAGQGSSGYSGFTGEVGDESMYSSRHSVFRREEFEPLTG